MRDSQTATTATKARTTAVSRTDGYTVSMEFGATSYLLRRNASSATLWLTECVQTFMQENAVRPDVIYLQQKTSSVVVRLRAWAGMVPDSVKYNITANSNGKTFNGIPVVDETVSLSNAEAYSQLYGTLDYYPMLPGTLPMVPADIVPPDLRTRILRAQASAAVSRVFAAKLTVEDKAKAVLDYWMKDRLNLAYNSDSVDAAKRLR